MRIVCVGGGPAGLYFAILMKQRNPAHVITVIERNRPHDTFGFGVVFSDATLGNLERADQTSFEQISASFSHWDDIDIYWNHERVRSTGHGFCGMERRRLLQILQERCQQLGVELRFEESVDDVAGLLKEADLVLGADGVGSSVRSAFADVYRPSIDIRSNRFVWLGTTFPFEAFTFYFRENQHGLWRVHAYRYSEQGSTFIVECTAETFERTGLAEGDEDQTVAYLEELFAEELAGHKLIKNRSIWRNFPTVRNQSWRAGNAVLVGDAAHTAHFSIGSGTKLAMEDSIALCDAIAAAPTLGEGLATYEASRRPEVEGLQRAAQVSLEWFEETERYRHLEPLPLAFSLLTRSLRVSHGNLARRDPVLVEALDAWLGARYHIPARAPALVPYLLAGRELPNRICALGSAGGAVEFHGQPVGLVLDHVVEIVVGSEPATAMADDVRGKLQAAKATVPAGQPLVAHLVAGGPGQGCDLAEGAAGRAAAEREDAAFVEVAALAASCGADAILIGEVGPEVSRLAYVALADRVRNTALVPTLVAGGVTSLDDISTVIAASRADLCVVG